MDSKLKRITIFSVLGVMILMLGTVVFVNWSRIQKEFHLDNINGQGETKVTEVSPKKTPQDDSDLSAFMNDETFFDEDENQYSSLNDSNSDEELSLLVTSIEKDLRVMIVDTMGNPVTGVSFYVNVEGNGDYKDLDKDGIVYIGGLSAGDYYVSLNQTEGYHILDTRVKVAVKDKVEYTAIKDISYLLKTEDEIDAKMEDTEKVDVESDATEITTAQLSDGTTQFGIDVSKWNQEIDWAKVKAAGVDYAIIRCGYRGSSTGALVEDPYFEKNIQGATNAGIKVGVYFFTQATSAVEAVEEASTVITLCKQYQLSYPIFIDTEGAGGNGRADSIDAATRTLVCKAFCETIRNEGFTTGIYASKNWFNHNLNISELSDYAIWLAEYKSSPTYANDYHMWQYTSNGTIDGISGRVDLNVCYISEE